MSRLFFALGVEALWPQELPKGRLLDPNERHITLAFLGDVELKLLLSSLSEFPQPSFSEELTGTFD